jgi:ribosomal protein L33
MPNGNKITQLHIYSKKKNNQNGKQVWVGIYVTKRNAQNVLNAVELAEFDLFRRSLFN